MQGGIQLLVHLLNGDAAQLEAALWALQSPGTDFVPQMCFLPSLWLIHVMPYSPICLYLWCLKLGLRYTAT